MPGFLNPFMLGRERARTRGGRKKRRKYGYACGRLWVVDPGREPEQGDDNLIDSPDDEDPNDILVTLATATPTGYQVGPMPDAEQPEYKHSRGEKLIDRLILFNWTAVGWCAGKIQNTNADGRKKIKVGVRESKPANFFVYHEHDEFGALHCL